MSEFLSFANLLSNAFDNAFFKFQQQLSEKFMTTFEELKAIADNQTVQIEALTAAAVAEKEEIDKALSNLSETVKSQQATIDQLLSQVSSNEASLDEVKSAISANTDKITAEIANIQGIYTPPVPTPPVPVE